MDSTQQTEDALIDEYTAKIAQLERERAEVTALKALLLLRLQDLDEEAQQRREAAQSWNNVWPAQRVGDHTEPYRQQSAWADHYAAKVDQMEWTTLLPIQQNAGAAAAVQAASLVPRQTAAGDASLQQSVVAQARRAVAAALGFELGITPAGKR